MASALAVVRHEEVASDHLPHLPSFQHANIIVLHPVQPALVASACSMPTSFVLKLKIHNDMSIAILHTH